MSLAALSDPALVPTALLQALGTIGTSSTSDERSLLSAMLRDKHLLLVLDNFEQILSAAELVGDILSNTPHVKVLATSRAPLHVYGEYQFAVPPLPLPNLARSPLLDQLIQFPTIVLFTARAQAVRSDFALTPANALVVAAICVRLDGLPLAIELAAAQSYLLTPQVLLRGLVEKQPVTRGSSRHASLRQRTLSIVFNFLGSEQAFANLRAARPGNHQGAHIVERERADVHCLLAEIEFHGNSPQIELDDVCLTL